MASPRTDDSIVPRLVFGLAFAAAGLLILALAPHRTLVCAHPARASTAACPLDDPVASSDCPTPPDIQCRLQAKIVGLIPSEDVRWDAIQGFDLLEEASKLPAAAKARRKGVERTLRFVSAQGPVDPGWHGKAFATRKRHDQLLEFARNPAAARIELVDSPKLPLVAGFVMLALGLLIVFNALAGRR